MYAPGAETVEVDVFDCGKISLKKDAKQEGYWVGEVKEVEPGFHYVAFEVNGTRVIMSRLPSAMDAFRRSIIWKCRNGNFISMN